MKAWAVGCAIWFCTCLSVACDSEPLVRSAVPVPPNSRASTYCRRPGKGYVSDFSEAYCFLEQRQEQELRTLSQDFPDYQPPPSFFANDQTCVEIQRLLATRWADAGTTPDAIKARAVATCEKNAASSEGATTRHEGEITTTVLVPILHRVRRAGDALGLHADGEIALGTLPRPGTSMASVRVPSSTSTLIIVDAEYPVLAVGLAKVLLPLLDALPQDTSDEAVARLVSDSPLSAAVFREELLRYVRPYDGRQLSPGFRYVSQTKELARRAMEFAVAAEVFGVAHEYLHVVRGHHRRAERTRCQHWAEELEADFWAQRLLDEIVLTHVPISGLELTPAARSGGFFAIAMQELMQKAHIDQEPTADALKMSQKRFEDAWDIVQRSIAKGATDDAAQRLAALGCAAPGAPEYPREWLRSVSLLRASFVAGVEQRDAKSASVRRLADTLWLAVRDDVRLAVAHRFANDRVHADSESDGDRALGNLRRAPAKASSRKLRLALRVSNEASIQDARGAGAGARAPLRSRAADFVYTVLELDQPGERAGDVLREFRVLSWQEPNQALRVCGPEGRAIYAQRLLEGGDIAEETASRGVCSGLSEGSRERIADIVSALSIVLPAPSVHKGARWTAAKMTAQNGRRVFHDARLGLTSTRKECVVELDATMNSPESPQNPRTPEDLRSHRRNGIVRGKVTLDCQGGAVERADLEASDTIVLADLNRGSQTIFTTRRAVAVTSLGAE
jgi:hypothetical protein